MGNSPEERAVIEAILQTGDQADVLRCLRSETTLLVLMVRIANDEKKAKWEETKQQREKEESDANLLV